MHEKYGIEIHDWMQKNKDTSFGQADQLIKKSLNRLGWREKFQHYSQGTQTRRLDKDGLTVIYHFMETEQANET
jgi:hypothetical protein